jgi:acetylornithine deacetylase/succinyl-diaminopimelate desuccinylase-like protein
MALLAALIAVDAIAQAPALERLRAYIEIDTTNPPGNETRGAEFFAGIFTAAGIPYELAESAPGRGNIWARLEGGDEPALILLHHMDVVPATAEAWDTDPLAAVEREGFLHGRGSQDTKSLGIMHLEAFLALHAQGQPLSRDVIFLATADEEAGGLFGAGWLAEHRPEIFAGAGYLLNEGGRGSRSAEQVWFEIEVAQKRPYWLRLTATDEPGHGSRPLPTSAPARLVAALQRLGEAPFPPRVIPPVRAMLQGVAPLSGPEWEAQFRAIDEAVQDPEFLYRFQSEKPGLHALIRNTCALTMLAGSQKINVIPPTASAELDCRILPDQDAAAFLADLRSRVADDEIEIEEIMLFGAAASPIDTPLFELLARISTQHYPGSSVVPAVLSGFTDSHFFRDMGIVSYGFNPAVATDDVLRGIHGNNERIEIASFERGVAIMQEIVQAFAGPGQTAARVTR